MALAVEEKAYKKKDEKEAKMIMTWTGKQSSWKEKTRLVAQRILLLILVALHRWTHAVNEAKARHAWSERFGLALPLPDKTFRLRPVRARPKNTPKGYRYFLIDR